MLVLTLAEGYGSAFNECVTKVDEETLSIDAPEKLKHGKLLLIECGDDGVMMPFIKFDDKKDAVICWEFCMYTEEGWVQINLATLPKNTKELKGPSITCEYIEPFRDMSGYAIQ